MDKRPDTGSSNKSTTISVNKRTGERLSRSSKATGITMGAIIAKACAKEIAAGAAILRARSSR